MKKRIAPLRIAIIGSGPAGFFCADYLLRLAQPCKVTLFERWPWPFGLVRDAVAPDKPNIRAAINAFTKIALSPDFSFCGNVTVGRDISINELHPYYHGIIIATGASIPRTLSMQGDSLPGCESAVSIAGWYNGRPDVARLRPNLDCISAVIIGAGNAALDIARMLALPPDQLINTDISDTAFQQLLLSKLTDIHIVGRREPQDARFSSQELELLGRIPNCTVELHSAIEFSTDTKDDPQRARLEKAYHATSKPAGPSKRHIHLHFNMRPSAILGTDKVTGVLFETAESETVHIPCGLVVASIGQDAEPLPGVPFDPVFNGIPNNLGRIQDAGGVILGMYAAGAVARGGNSTIGANKPDCLQAVQGIMEDRNDLIGTELEEEQRLYASLRDRGISYVTFTDWRRIDNWERQRGELKGKVRERFTAPEEALAMLNETEEQGRSS